MQLLSAAMVSSYTAQKYQSTPHPTKIVCDFLLGAAIDTHNFAKYIHFTAMFDGT